MSHIFIVEDESDIREILTHHLHRAGHSVEGMGDGESALAYFDSLSRDNSVRKPDLVILDLMLPVLSGFDLCKHMRQTNSPLMHTPLLMLTAKSQTIDIVTGLELGADDYLIKPFEIPEVLARVSALLRRANSLSPKASQSILKNFGILQVDTKRFKAWVHEEELDLTASEFKILTALIDTDGGVLTRSQLINKIRGEGVVVVDRTVDFHVLGLRRKLGGAGTYIETVRGIGYRFHDPLAKHQTL